MHFSQETFKGTHLKIKTETDTSNFEELIQQPFSNATGGYNLQFRKEEHFMDFEQQYSSTNETTENELMTSIREFFPSSDLNDINNRLNDNTTLTSSVQERLHPSSIEKIDLILEQVNNLSSVEKLLLYLKLPTGKTIPDPSKQPQNPLGGRPEIFETIAWIKTHLKEDRTTSIPKQDVYSQYEIYCSMNGIKPLATADFGKVMKQVYPNVIPRRLGTRGNSRYCYSGMSCRTSLPPPTLPMINHPIPSESSSTEDGGGRTCAWAAQVLGTPISSLSELEAHLASRGLPTSKESSSITDDAWYLSSSKVFTNDRRSLDGDNLKKEDDSSASNKTPPERCKGKRRSGGKRGGGSGGKKKAHNTDLIKKGKTEDEEKPSKLPLPRLLKIPKSEVTSKTVKRQPKPLQPKQEPFIENGNSLEQEEELVKYFQQGTEQKTVQVSQLRMLLEKKEDKSRGSSQSRRRVSFEAVPESPKKFSFVPISPVSPFVQPKRVLHRSSSVSSPQDKIRKKDIAPPPPPLLNRSQSVPMVLPQITPVPSEAVDFGLDSTDSSNLLVMDESSESLLLDSDMNNENLNTIFSLITEIESERSSSYSATPTAVPRSSFFEEIDYDQSLSDLSHLNVDVSGEVYNSGTTL